MKQFSKLEMRTEKKRRCYPNGLKNYETCPALKTRSMELEWFKLPMFSIRYITTEGRWLFARS
jgi:hypothetical protein